MFGAEHIVTGRGRKPGRARGPSDAESGVARRTPGGFPPSAGLEAISRKEECRFQDRRPLKDTPTIDSVDATEIAAVHRSEAGARGWGSATFPGLLVVSLEPFELLAHYFARRERPRVWLWESVRQEDLGKAPIRSRRLVRIVSGDRNEVVDHFAGVIDALNRYTTATSITEEEATGFGQQRRIGRLGHAHEENDCNGDGQR